jgi:glutamate formiminotransferase
VQAIAVPNVSEGRDRDRVRALVAAIERHGALVLDIHSDPVHHRSVFTVAGEETSVVRGLAELAVATRYIDLRRHRGVHPRLGGLDVCPIVAHGITLKHAVSLARAAAEEIADAADLPVYLYGAAAVRVETRDLPTLRRGGLKGLIARAEEVPPDLGPRTIDPARGVVCVGARGVLIAFNVWLDCDEATARAIARRVRARDGGLPELRAIGVAISSDASQVSMNLVKPSVTGMDAAFDAVAREARARGVEVTASELVGLVPERYAPAPDQQAARLLMKPGRTLEGALRVSTSRSS